jgi:hypothetical protein
MNLRRLLPLSLCLLAACAGARQDIRLTSEPSIERAFDILQGTPEGKPLMKFLYRNPLRFEYSNTPGLCYKFSLKTGKILIPEDYKSSDLLLALTAARAAHIYRLGKETGLDEIIAEEEELAALFQARLAVEINVVEKDFPAAARHAAAMKADFCAYVLESSRYAMRQARKEALAADADCQRPLETLEAQRVWLEKARKAINEENFYQLVYERDMDKVRKGAMPMSEAMRKDARLRALPSYEVYRYQRTFYDKQTDIFRRFEKAYAGETAADEAWRASHKDDLDRAREEFSACGLPY